MEHLSETRRAILTLIKRHGGATLGELGEELPVSAEAARQQLVSLEKDGFVERAIRRRGESTVGRPPSEYRLTRSGDELFPKAYDDLAVEMIDTVSDRLGPDALRTVLRSMADARVDRWASRLEGLSLPEKLEALRDMYAVDDPYTEAVHEEGVLRLIERNCPFVGIASRRPALCSVTVTTLQRLLGYRVRRVERFQNGDGRCVFEVLVDEPLDHPPGFELEGEHGRDPATSES